MEELLDIDYDVWINGQSVTSEDSKFCVVLVLFEPY